MQAFLMPTPPLHDYDRAMRIINKFDFLSSVRFLGESVGTTAAPRIPDMAEVASKAFLEQCLRVDAFLDTTESKDYVYSKHLTPILHEAAKGNHPDNIPPDLGTENTAD